MKFIKTFIVILFSILLFSSAAHTSDNNYTKTIEVFLQSDAVKPFFDDAYGYAIFPNVGKGGIILGGAYGSGRVYLKEKVAGKTTLVKLSIGMLLGGQAFSEIIFFKNKPAYDQFTSGNYEFEGSLSAVVITTAVQARTSTQGNTAGASLGPATGTQAETSYTKGMAVFIHTLGGFMYEMSVGGQKFTFTPTN